MTEFLVFVANLDEARQAIAAGADRLGVLEEAGVEEIAEIRALARKIPILARASRPQRVKNLLAAGCDILTPAAIFQERAHDARFARAGARWAASFDPASFDAAQLPDLAAAGCATAFLESEKATGTRLLARLSISEISDFVEAAHRAGLACGLSGRLQAPDIPRLLVLEPDFLGFRHALKGHAEGLDAPSLKLFRALMPRAGEKTPRFEGAEIDRVFVRDFTVDMRIGAYAHEKTKPQRVRINVVADVWRRPREDDDFANLFSYDVITDAINHLAAAGHIALVETLAERIATVALRDQHVRQVNVRVEKLDVIAGSVGVEITRLRRAVPPKKRNSRAAPASS